MLSMTTATAKEAFAMVIQWQIAERFTNAAIRDNTNTYSMDAFSVAMAFLAISNAVELDVGPV